MRLTRLFVQRVLGFLWLCDGLLQLKPAMFTAQFLSQVILPMAQSQPGWIARSVQWGAHLVEPRLALWNAFFAAVQIAIGALLLANVRVKWALWASFAWSVCVWWFGEGLGQLWTGSALLLTGAPGSALLYACVGAAVYPRRAEDAAISSRGRNFARWSLVCVWMAGALLQLQPAYLEPGGLAQAVPFFGPIRLVGMHGPQFSILLCVVQALLGIAFLAGAAYPFSVPASIALSALFWWWGQSFGQIFAPTATDFNSGPLVILLSLCAWRADGAPIRSILARRREARE